MLHLDSLYRGTTCTLAKLRNGWRRGLGSIFLWCLSTWQESYGRCYLALMSIFNDIADRICCFWVDASFYLCVDRRAQDDLRIRIYYFMLKVSPGLYLGAETNYKNDEKEGNTRKTLKHLKRTTQSKSMAQTYRRQQQHGMASITGIAGTAWAYNNTHL